MFFFCVWGSQALAAYSSVGLTYWLYACVLTCLSRHILACCGKSGSWKTMVTSDFTPEKEIWPFRACAMKNVQYNPYLRPNRRNFLWGTFTYRLNGLRNEYLAYKTLCLPSIMKHITISLTAFLQTFCSSSLHILLSNRLICWPVLWFIPLIMNTMYNFMLQC